MRNRDNRSGMTAADINAVYMDDREDELLDAAVTAAALVARADGTVEPIERSEMLHVLRRNGLLSVFTRFEILDAFDARLRQLEEDEGMEIAKESLGRLAGRSPAWLVVQTGERVAAADRHVNGRELQMLRLIHVALTRPSEAERARTADGRRAFGGRIDHMTARGERGRAAGRRQYAAADDTAFGEEELI